MPKLIIGLVGLQGCGKGTVADVLREQYGAGYERFSGMIGSILDILAIEKNRKNFTKLSEVIRYAFGETIFSYALEKKVIESTQDIIVLDGIRRPEDIVAMEPLPHFHLVSIEADQKLRFERMKKRGEKATEANMTWEQFLAEEALPTEVTIPFVMNRAKYHFSNNGTREQLIEQVRTFMKQFGIEPK